MASETYNETGIVLRKTPLGETDLIVSLLTENGSQLRAVAKGARKPSSALSSRLELYSVAQLHCARGKSLDIVKEARLVDSNAKVRADLEHSAAAAPLAELLAFVSDDGLADARLFVMTSAAFRKMGEAKASDALALCAAHLLKILSVIGFRPSLDSCIRCGAHVSLGCRDTVAVSDIDGGVLCDKCSSFSETRLAQANTISWCNAFINSTFDGIIAMGVSPNTSFSVLEFAHQWIRVHVGKSLKSMNFLFTCGLF
jgi:DNA repair protein RecO (recombination protein O)